MNLIFYEDAKADLKKIDNSLLEFFRKHIKKISEMPPRRHMKSGLPYHIEEVTKQARIVYDYQDDETILIIHCFALHKEYEKWYRTFA